MTMDKERLNQTFKNWSWPASLKFYPLDVADVTEKTPDAFGRVINFRDSKDQQLGRIGFTFYGDSAYINTIRLYTEKTGLGRQLTAFMMDELVGMGAKIICVDAQDVGGHFWNKMAFLPRHVPDYIDSNFNFAAPHMSGRQRWEIGRLLPGRLMRSFNPANMWALSDRTDILSNGQKSSHAILLGTKWAGRFETSCDHTKTRLKTYTRYPFKNI